MQSTDLLSCCQVQRIPKTYKNVHLLRELVKRDFHARFTGSALGIFWAVLQPLSLVILYWFVFTYMFSRGPAADNKNYIDFLIAGLLPWLGLNEGIIRRQRASSITRRWSAAWPFAASSSCSFRTPRR